MEGSPGYGPHTLAQVSTYCRGQNDYFSSGNNNKYQRLRMDEKALLRVRDLREALRKQIHQLLYFVFSSAFFNYYQSNFSLRLQKTDAYLFQTDTQFYHANTQFYLTDTQFIKQTHYLSHILMQSSAASHSCVFIRVVHIRVFISCCSQLYTHLCCSHMYSYQLQST